MHSQVCHNPKKKKANRPHPRILQVNELKSIGFNEDEAFEIIDKLSRSELAKILRGGIKRHRRHNPKFKKLSRPAQVRVSKKIRKLMNEGYGQKMAAAIAYSMERKHKLGPRGGKKRNPIEDKDIYECLAALAGMIVEPNRCEDVPEHILDALESEGMWSVDEGVTAKGKKFLMDAGWTEEDEFSD